MLSRLYYMLRLSSPGKETLHPLDCQALQPSSNTTKQCPQANHTKSGLNLPREDTQTLPPAALDMFAEISNEIMRRIDSLTAEVERLQEEVSARSKRRKLGKAQCRCEVQKAVGQQAQPYFQKGDGCNDCNDCKQPGETKGRRCRVCGEPGHNVRTCQTQTVTVEGISAKGR